MNAAEHGRKAATVWRAMHLSAAVTIAGVAAAFGRPDSANGIGLMLGSFQLALGGFVSMYAHTQGKVDLVRGPNPPARMSGTLPEVPGA